MRHDADHLAQQPHAELPDGRFVDQDLARVVLVETRQQIHQRGFACASGSDQRDGLAGARVKADVLESGRALVAVTEAGLVEPHLATHAHHFFRHIPARLRRFVDDLKDALARRASRLHELVKLVQFIDRLIQKSGEHEERDQIAHLHCAAQHGSRSHPDRQNNSERADQIHRGMINCPDAHHDERGIAKLIADRIETAMLFALPDETLDLPDSRQVIMQQGIHRRRSAALQAVPPMCRERVPKRAAR